MAQKLLCNICITPQKILKEIGNFRRLECGHLVTFNKENLITEEEVKEAIEIVQKVLENAEEYLKLFKNKKRGYTPYDYQIKGIQFAIDSGFRCLIADEQGVGKTVQALGIMYYAMKYCEDTFFPCLIVAKSSLKIQWMVNLLDWCGMDYIPQIIEDGKNPPIPGFNVYIASYDIFRRFSTEEDIVIKTKWGHEVETKQTKNPFYDFGFKTIIADEVQAVKGESKRTNEFKKICEGKQVIALSGTPIKNNADEYYTILHILRPDLFRTRKGYRDQWVRLENVNGYDKYTGIKYPEAFKEYTKDFILRRTREDVAEEIGLKVTGANRIFYHVDFESEKLKAAYQAAENEFIREMEKAGKKNPIEIIGMLSVMRHLVGINKILPTVELAEEFALESPGQKLIIFAHHQDVMQGIWAKLGEVCKDGGMPLPLSFHSGLNMNQRYDMVSDFLKPESSPFLIASTLAMGEGVDRLQEVCNNCIIAERQWNPANEEQAEARLVRIGQIKGFVNATYPIATDTIDEYFTEIVEVKRRSMKETLDGVSAQWDENSLIMALYEAISKKGRKKIKRGF